MFERKFTYEGFDGKTYEDTWGFYLSKADILEIQLGTFVGLDQLMKRLIETQNGKEIMAVVKEIILKSVGHTSPDGRKFLRNEDLRDEFYQTDAYSQLFTELVTDPEKVLEFIFGAVPKDIGDKMREEYAKTHPTADSQAAAE
jgi:hypothetical protein